MHMFIVKKIIRGENGALLGPDKLHSPEMKKALMRTEKGHLLQRIIRGNDQMEIGIN